MSVLDNITKRVTHTAKAAAKRSGDVVELTRLNMNINSEEEKIKKICMDIGKLLYADYSEGKVIDGILLVNCEKIDSINRNIEDMKQKILELRNVKECSGCGTELVIDMAYCHKCGRKQDVADQEAAVDAEDT